MIAIGLPLASMRTHNRLDHQRPFLGHTSVGPREIQHHDAKRKVAQSSSRQRSRPSHSHRPRYRCGNPRGWPGPPWGQAPLKGPAPVPRSGAETPIGFPWRCPRPSLPRPRNRTSTRYGATAAARSRATVSASPGTRRCHTPARSRAVQTAPLRPSHFPPARRCATPPPFAIAPTLRPSTPRCACQAVSPLRQGPETGQDRPRPPGTTPGL